MADFRQIAVGDIHGCLKTFRALVWDKLQLDTKRFTSKNIVV